MESQHVAVSRRIPAAAADIFRVLADPKRHVDLDGSGMVRGSVTETTVTVVTESYDCSSLPEDERESIENGRIWIESMTRTLERLDEVCTQ